MYYLVLNLVRGILFNYLFINYFFVDVNLIIKCQYIGKFGVEVELVLEELHLFHAVVQVSFYLLLLCKYIDQLN